MNLKSLHIYAYIYVYKCLNVLFWWINVNLNKMLNAHWQWLKEGCSEEKRNKCKELHDMAWHIYCTSNIHTYMYIYVICALFRFVCLRDECNIYCLKVFTVNFSHITHIFWHNLAEGASKKWQTKCPNMFQQKLPLYGIPRHAGRQLEFQFFFFALF